MWVMVVYECYVCPVSEFNVIRKFQFSCSISVTTVCNQDSSGDFLNEVKIFLFHFFMSATAVSKSNKFICYRDKNFIHWKLQQIIPDKKFSRTTVATKHWKYLIKSFLSKLLTYRWKLGIYRHIKYIEYIIIMKCWLVFQDISWSWITSKLYRRRNLLFHPLLYLTIVYIYTLNNKSNLRSF